MHLQTQLSQLIPPSRVLTSHLHRIAYANGAVETLRHALSGSQCNACQVFAFSCIIPAKETSHDGAHRKDRFHQLPRREYTICYHINYPKVMLNEPIET